MDLSLSVVKVIRFPVQIKNVVSPPPDLIVKVIQQNMGGIKIEEWRKVRGVLELQSNHSWMVLVTFDPWFPLLI